MSISLKTQPTYIDETKVKNLFEKYDKNRNGVLEKNEFIKILVDILTQLGEDLPVKRKISNKDCKQWIYEIVAKELAKKINTFKF